MSDSYLAISEIANSDAMTERMRAAVTQQKRLGNTPKIGGYPPEWVVQNRYVWASSPGWAEAWDYANNVHGEESDYDPGKDPAVITDGMILATVQALGV